MPWRLNTNTVSSVSGELDVQVNRFISVQGIAVAAGHADVDNVSSAGR